VNREVAESVQRPTMALEVAGGNVCTVRHVAAVEDEELFEISWFLG